MQQDALERLEPDADAARAGDAGGGGGRRASGGTLLSLRASSPSKTKETARAVVRKVVEELERRLAARLRQAVRGSLNRATRTRRPAHNEIDWHRTIRANLKHYQPDRARSSPRS